MSSASPDSGLINALQHAEKDLALYAAIIGCKPTVDQPPAQVVAAEPELPASDLAVSNLAESPTADLESTDPHHSHRISVWMRHVSDEAKKRIHEARMRLAS